MSRQKRKRLRCSSGWRLQSWKVCLPAIAIIILLCAEVAVAQNPPSELTSLQNQVKYLQDQVKSLKIALDTIWVIFTGCLVFFMNAGFGMLEAGLCRQKNAANILTKNLIVFALSTAAYWAVGFAFMFGNGNPFIGLSGFYLKSNDVFDSLKHIGIPLNAKFFFQLVLAGTAATIVSGAVAERIKFAAFCLFSLLLVAIIYPITGHWIWGGGWLQGLKFWDFAGSTVVHSVGGWSALVGVYLLGPRKGKYIDGVSYGLPGHNLSLGILGCFILWLGWFGFNPGSTMELEPKAISHIVLTTNTAACAGGIAAAIATWLNPWDLNSKPDPTMIINGVLSGLVAITASCRFVTIGNAIAIGLLAGIIVVFSVDFWDRMKIDDPVGAISVHLVGGVWGTLALGLFSEGPGDLYSDGDGPVAGLFRGVGINSLKLLGIQLLGIVAVGLSTVFLSSLAWLFVKKILSSDLRVTEKAEREGLDFHEHRMSAYSGFLFRADVKESALKDPPRKN
ncbi:ammonium transporter [Moorena bouillonii]|uniref:Ammonium transporter n=1 Tax=Moorena bouillonii PNG TaxID=568701 RepID=A0A1U7N4S8_9CYAN|nr:ammonium transporter [Moorena bouillonii]OLT60931.1 ammonium transporter [Moorena bouillonii PNG]